MVNTQLAAYVGDPDFGLILLGYEEAYVENRTPVPPDRGVIASLRRSYSD